MKYIIHFFYRWWCYFILSWWGLSDTTVYPSFCDRLPWRWQPGQTFLEVMSEQANPETDQAWVNVKWHKGAQTNGQCFPSYLFDKHSVSVLHLVDLHDSCSAGKVPQADKLGAAGDPFAVEDGVVQTLLNMCNYLRLRQWRWHPWMSAINRIGVLFLRQNTEKTGRHSSLPKHMTFRSPWVRCRADQKYAWINEKPTILI